MADPENAPAKTVRPRVEHILQSPIGPAPDSASDPENGTQARAAKNVKLFEVANPSLAQETVRWAMRNHKTPSRKLRGKSCGFISGSNTLFNHLTQATCIIPPSATPPFPSRHGYPKRNTES